MAQFSRRGFLTGASAVALLAAATACGAKSGGGSGASGNEMTFLYSPYADYAPFFVAKEKGYFAEEGLDVTLTQKPSSGDTVQLLATDAAQAGGISWAAALFNQANSEAASSVKVLSGISKIGTTGKNPAPFLIRKESGITNISDLKGKRVGTLAKGGFGYYSTNLALRSAGLSIDDVTIVNVDLSSLPAAFENGGVDAAWTIEPMSSALERENLAVDILPVSYHAGTEVGALAMSASFLENNPESAVKFITAYLRGVQTVENGGWQDPEIQAIISKYTKLSADLIPEIGLSVYDPQGRIDWDNVTAQEEYSKEIGVLSYKDTGRLEATLFAPEFLPKAIAALPTS
ncbi:ABC transporter substrate-binding protein [Rhodococcus globerulus]|uniref:NrtA/SsuA/CpmA family ABC transporter substrate-binding protein n=1 Tax=Rhodococcus globerulus TaxID=33008 RepID=A0ABU4C4Y3_RHOGO|nr:NrtA/SsuA/CpmA family ABC transporter substrate-binding protein [Rhodococcus globerulus]MDV6271570.1 NrtA/SsuA/CpmA family ABC transporter substrate-binding protein [Rhodococcus globerulus]